MGEAARAGEPGTTKATKESKETRGDVGSTEEESQRGGTRLREEVRRLLDGVHLERSTESISLDTSKGDPWEVKN